MVAAARMAVVPAIAAAGRTAREGPTAVVTPVAIRRGRKAQARDKDGGRDRGRLKDRDRGKVPDRARRPIGAPMAGGISRTAAAGGMADPRVRKRAVIVRIVRADPADGLRASAPVLPAPDDVRADPGAVDARKPLVRARRDRATDGRVRIATVRIARARVAPAAAIAAGAISVDRDVRIAARIAGIVTAAVRAFPAIR